MIAGGDRLEMLSRGEPILPDNIGFFEAPVPVIIHIVSVIISACWAHFNSLPIFAPEGQIGIVLRVVAEWLIHRQA